MSTHTVQEQFGSRSRNPCVDARACRSAVLPRTCVTQVFAWKISPKVSTKVFLKSPLEEKEAGGEGEGRVDGRQALKGPSSGLDLFKMGVFCPRESKSPEHAHIAMMARSNGLKHQQLWVKSHSLGRRRNLSPS